MRESKQSVTPNPTLANDKGDYAGPVSGVQGTNDEHYLTFWRLNLVTASLYLGTLLVAIDTTIISVAVPRISSSFQALNDVGWYGSGYLLTVTACQPSFGKIYKFFNVKGVYMASILIFEVGSLLCAVSPTSPVFILGRAISGIGAAGLYQGALSIIGYSCALEKRPFYISLVLSVFGISACFGPLLGGALTDHVSWRWCFWINLPIGAVTFILVSLVLRLPKSTNAERDLAVSKKLVKLDPLGATLIVGAVCCLLLALQWGGTTLPWTSTTVIGLFIGFGLLTIVFAITQYIVGEDATVPLRLLRQRSVLMGAWFSFFLEMSLYIDIYFIPFYFQAVREKSATASGIRIIPLCLSQIVAVVVVGAIVSKTGHYVPFMILGEIVSIVGTGMLTRINTGTPTAIWATYFVVTGLGHGAGLQLPFTALQVVLKETDLPTGNAIVIFFSQLGAAIAIAAGQSILVTTLSKELVELATGVPAEAIIKAGPLNLSKIANSSAVLSLLRTAYDRGIHNVLVLSLVAICTAMPFVLGMQWLNVKKVAEKGSESGVTALEEREQGS